MFDIEKGRLCWEMQTFTKGMLGQVCGDEWRDNQMLGGPVEKMWFFQMAPIPLLSVLICFTRCQYDILQV